MKPVIVYFSCPDGRNEYHFSYENEAEFFLRLQIAIKDVSRQHGQPREFTVVFNVS